LIRNTRPCRPRREAFKGWKPRRKIQQLFDPQNATRGETIGSNNCNCTAHSRPVFGPVPSFLHFGNVNELIRHVGGVGHDKTSAAFIDVRQVEYWAAAFRHLVCFRPLKDHLGSGVAAVSRWLQTAPSRCS
jgi:hypothetical protein